MLSLPFFSLEQFEKEKAQLISLLIGIGWGGINAVNHMIEANISGVEFWAIDADIAMLSRRAAAPNSLQIGSGLSRPLNLSDIAWGEMLADESHDEIAGVLEETDLLFLVASIGDDTAVGAASIVAEVAKEMAVLTIGVVNCSYFDSQIEPLKSRLDALIVIPSYTYDMSCQAVQSISDLITIPGLLNPDFADLCTVMTDRGTALIGIGVSSGRSRARKAAKAVISSPFLEYSLEEAQGIAFHISGSSNLTLQEVNVAVETIYKVVNPKANIVFGATIDDTLQDEIRITVIATGLKYLGIFQKLRNLLVQGKWEDADNETANLMFQLSGQVYEMSSEYTKTVPFTEFNTIDQLWNEYSHGRFGFSIQKRIWQEEYSKLGEFDSNKIYARFCETVGWCVINGCLLSSYLNFSLNAPVGHLPVKVAGQGWSAASFLGSITYKTEENKTEKEILEKVEPLTRLENLGIYQRLRRLLAAEKWRAANHETRRVMLKLSGQIKQGDFQKGVWVRSGSLYIINKLWVIYSNGHFGFSVQEKIWQKVHKDFQDFGTHVGWGLKRRKDYLWIPHHKLNFSLDAPLGHLPAIFPCLNQYRGFNEHCVCSILSYFEFISN